MEGIDYPPKEFTYRQMDLSVDILVRNITKIHSVEQWADLIGYSRSHFCRKFTQRFGENPKKILRRARFRSICRAIQSDWSATAYKIAKDTGIQNEKALHKFLNRNFSVSFLALKDHLKKEAFRSRNIISQVADEAQVYLRETSDLLKISSLPLNGGMEKMIPHYNESKHLKPEYPGNMK